MRVNLMRPWEIHVMSLVEVVITRTRSKDRVFRIHMIHFGLNYHNCRGVNGISLVGQGLVVMLHREGEIDDPRPDAALDLSTPPSLKRRVERTVAGR